MECLNDGKKSMFVVCERFFSLFCQDCETNLCNYNAEILIINDTDFNIS